jgi:hypothetical protein
MDVHEHYVRAVLREVFQGGLAAVIHTQATKTRRAVHERGDGLAQLLLIVHYRNSNHDPVFCLHHPVHTAAFRNALKSS